MKNKIIATILLIVSLAVFIVALQDVNQANTIFNQSTTYQFNHVTTEKDSIFYPFMVPNANVDYDGANLTSTSITDGSEYNSSKLNVDSIIYSSLVPSIKFSPSTVSTMKGWNLGIPNSENYSIDFSISVYVNETFDYTDMTFGFTLFGSNVSDSTGDSEMEDISIIGINALRLEEMTFYQMFDQLGETRINVSTEEIGYLHIIFDITNDTYAVSLYDWDNTLIGINSTDCLMPVNTSHYQYISFVSTSDGEESLDFMYSINEISVDYQTEYSEENMNDWELQNVEVTGCSSNQLINYTMLPTLINASLSIDSTNMTISDNTYLLINEDAFYNVHLLDSIDLTDVLTANSNFTILSFSEDDLNTTLTFTISLYWEYSFVLNDLSDALVPVLLVTFPLVIVVMGYIYKHQE